MNPIQHDKQLPSTKHTSNQIGADNRRWRTTLKWPREELWRRHRSKSKPQEYIRSARYEKQRTRNDKGRSQNTSQAQPQSGRHPSRELNWDEATYYVSSKTRQKYHAESVDQDKEGTKRRHKTSSMYSTSHSPPSSQPKDFRSDVDCADTEDGELSEYCVIVAIK